MQPNASDLVQRAKVFKALGHPSRLLMIEALGQGEKCVCELRELVGSDISTVSKHLTVLKEAGLVRDERRGTNIYYSLRMGVFATPALVIDGTIKAVGGIPPKKDLQAWIA